MNIFGKKKDVALVEFNSTAIVEEKIGKVQIELSKPEVIRLIKERYCSGATDTEFALFMETCRFYGLDPRWREVSFAKWQKTDRYGKDIKDKFNQFDCITRDGYRTLLERDPDYITMRSALVHKSDEFWCEYEDQGVYDFYHKQTHLRTEIVGAWCEIRMENGRSDFTYLTINDAYLKKSTFWGTPGQKRFMMLKTTEKATIIKILPRRIPYMIEEFQDAPYDKELAKHDAIEMRDETPELPKKTTKFPEHGVDYEFHAPVDMILKTEGDDLIPMGYKEETLVEKVTTITVDKDDVEQYENAIDMINEATANEKSKNEVDDILIDFDLGDD